MEYMFGAEDFNQPLNAWDVCHVTDMSFLFSRFVLQPALGLLGCPSCP